MATTSVSVSFKNDADSWSLKLNEAGVGGDDKLVLFNTSDGISVLSELSRLVADEHDGLLMAFI